MKLNKSLASVILALTIITLAGCGGGGGGETKTPTPVPVPVPVPVPTITKNIVDKWFYIYEGTQCTEIYLFNLDGSFSIDSGDEFIEGTFTFEETVDEGARHPLVMTFTNQTRLDDCEGERADVVGGELPIYVAFNNDSSLNIFETETSTEILIELTRDNSLQFSNLVENVNYEELVQFSVETEYSSDETAKILYGPKGMNIDIEGNVTWQPEAVMMEQSLTVTFGFSIANGLAKLEGEITIEDPARQLPLVRTGIEVPYVKNGLWVADFDDDEDNEILVINRQNIISLLSHKDGEYVQKWVYPFAFEDSSELLKVAALDMSGDGKSDIIIMTTKAIYQITNLANKAEKIFETEKFLVDFVVADANNDGYVDLAVLEQESSNSSANMAINLWSLKDNSLTFSTNLSSQATSILYGNTDNDEQLEVIASSGVIYDGISGDNEWYLPDGFGKNFSVGDINNDGIDEVITSKGWGAVNVYDTITKSIISTINLDFNDICTTKVANIDSDAAMEVLIGNCQWGNIFAFDIKDNEASEQWRLDMIEHSSVSLTTGDVDNDGQIEVIWGSGITSSGEDVLVVAESGPEASVVWYNENPSQLDSFRAAGWGNISPEKEASVFVVPSTDSGYSGQRIVQMDMNGDIKVSDEVASNWDNATHARVTDYDNNGYADIFLASANLYDGFFVVKEIDSFITKWGGSAGEYDDNIGVVDYMDVNQDGFDDAIVTNGKTLDIIDIQNQLILDTLVNESYIRDIAKFITSDGEQQLIIATNENLSIYGFEDNKLSRLTQVSEPCGRIVSNANSGTIVCLAYNNARQLKLLNQQLMLTSTSSFDEDITDFISIEGSENILVAFKHSINYSESNYHIAEVDAKSGSKIWSSPKLLGEVPMRSLHFVDSAYQNKPALTFSSSNAMYITR
ncbi:FG-GAP repeat domain-containing protein [Colwelliaceae bacterium BS250]